MKDKKGSKDKMEAVSDGKKLHRLDTDNQGMKSIGGDKMTKSTQILIDLGTRLGSSWAL